MNKDSKALEALYEGIIAERHDEVTTFDSKLGRTVDSPSMAHKRNQALVTLSNVGNVLEREDFKHVGHNKYVKGKTTVLLDVDLEGNLAEVHVKHHPDDEFEKVDSSSLQSIISGIGQGYVSDKNATR